MKICPFCKKEVEELRGDCPHCHENLDAEGLRELMLEQRSDSAKFHDSIQELRKKEDDNEARLKVIEDKLQERQDYLAAIEGGEEQRPKPVNLGKVIRALTNKNWDGAEYEGEVIEKHADKLRALSTGAIGTGGAIIPSEYMPQELVELLHASVILESLGARTLTGLTGSPVYIPRISGGAQAYHVAENAGKTPTDQSFEQISMTPHEVAAATIFSKRMALMSNPSVDRMIQEDLLRVLGEAVDYQGLFGDGAGNRPVGVLNTVGISTYTLVNDAGNGAIPIPADIDGTELVLETANASRGKVGWAFHPRSKMTFKSMRDESGGAGTTTGGWLFRDDIKAGELDGYPFGQTTQIPVNITKGLNNDCSYIFHGNWDDLIIAYWGGLELATSDQAGDTFIKNQIIIKASLLYDIALRHVESIVVTDGVRR